MRRLLADLADGREVGDTTTIGDPGTIDTLRKQIAAQRAREA
jgi:hypothetical protein